MFLENGTVEQTLSGQEDKVNAVVVIDGKRIVSASGDGTLKVWSLESGKEIALIGLDGALQCVAVRRQAGRSLVVASDAAGTLDCLELVEPYLTPYPLSFQARANVTGRTDRGAGNWLIILRGL